MNPEPGKIYLGNCVPLMKSWPDKCVDLVVSDPPYGMNWLSNSSKYGNRFGKIQGDDKYPLDALKEMMRLARRAVFCFMRWDNLAEVPKPKSFIVWVKGGGGMGDLEHEYGRNWEGCAFWPLAGHAFINRPFDTIDTSKIPPGKLVHPTEKPVVLLTEILRNNVGDIVLDPYCGSGSTLLAAEKLGRKWIGCEIEKKYCDIAQGRIDAERSQGRLF